MNFNCLTYCVPYSALLKFSNLENSFPIFINPVYISIDSCHVIFFLTHYHQYFLAYSVEFFYILLLVVRSFSINLCIRIWFAASAMNLMNIKLDSNQHKKGWIIHESWFQKWHQSDKFSAFVVSKLTAV